MAIVQRLASLVDGEGVVSDVRVGTHWTLVVVDRSGRQRGGIASTQVVHGEYHGVPSVRDAGRLIGQPAGELLSWMASPSLTERSIGFATLNALLPVDEARCRTLNAEALILEHGRGKHVAIIGHFPFVPRVREAAAVTSVLELSPGPGDLPADAAPQVLPNADVVAITGMSLVNGTFEALAALCRPDAFVVLLGGTTPLTERFFEYGVDAVSGTVIEDIDLAARTISQGASFRQIAGKRLLTMVRA